MTYGWRARVGYVTPSDTLETPFYEFQMMAPEGVAMVATCLNINHVTKESVDVAWERVAEAARSVVAYNVDCLIVGGAPLAFLKGPGSHLELARMVESVAKVPTITEMGSAVNALRHVGAERLVIGSPFDRKLNDQLVGFLESENFEVLAAEGYGLTSNAEITMLPLRESYRVARNALRRAPQADAIYIPCPRWPVSPNVEHLERDLGVRVVASVQANLWSSLRSVGIAPHVPGFGWLLGSESSANGSGSSPERNRA